MEISPIIVAYPYLIGLGWNSSKNLTYFIRYNHFCIPIPCNKSVSRVLYLGWWEAEKNNEYVIYIIFIRNNFFWLPDNMTSCKLK